MIGPARGLGCYVARHVQSTTVSAVFGGAGVLECGGSVLTLEKLRVEVRAGSD